MFKKLFQFFAIIIVTVIVGHSVVQAHVLDAPGHGAHDNMCEGDDCHHDLNLSLCEIFDSVDLHIKSDTENIIMINNGYLDCFRGGVYYETQYTEIVFWSILISHNQLARSHL